MLRLLPKISCLLYYKIPSENQAKTETMHKLREKNKANRIHGKSKSC